MTFADKVNNFYKNLKLPEDLPAGVEVMQPLKDEEVSRVLSKFYQKYFSDNQPRLMLIGINPGRFGGGITGIPFTDPVKLNQVCHINNDWEQKRELSADFIYQLINHYGGVEKFYADCYITAASPLGFTRNGLNLNYYDDPALQKAVEPFIIKSLRQQLSFGMLPQAISLGTGKNFHYLRKLNSQYHFFEKIHALEHPRYIMQYKRKKLAEYLEKYIFLINNVKNL